MICQADSLAMIRAHLVAARTILHDMTMVEHFASDVTTVKDALIDRCDDLKKTMDAVISLCQTTSDTTSPTSVLNGSDAFTWTCQQLSSTDWYGPPRISNSYTKWVFAGKPGTSEGSGLKSSGSATPQVMSTNVSTCTTREALIKLNKSIMEAEAYRQLHGL